MVKSFIVSAALAAASIASVAQAASLKQDPLFGCVVAATGTLGLGSPEAGGAISEDAIPVGFVAGRTGKSRITGTSKNSVLATTGRNGDHVSPQNFEFLNCTQSLINRGYTLNVPNSFAALSDDGTTFTYSWGVLRNEGSDKHSLSAKIAQDKNGKLDGVALLNTKVSNTPVQYRTFIMATADDSTSAFLEYYPFAGTKKAPKAGVFYPANDKWGTLSISTNLTKHDDSAFLTLGALDDAYYTSD